MMDGTLQVVELNGKKTRSFIKKIIFTTGPKKKERFYFSYSEIPEYVHSTTTVLHIARLDGVKLLETKDIVYKFVKTK